MTNNHAGLQPLDVLRFLMGEGPLNGVWFDQTVAGEPFWWRKHLRPIIALLSAPRGAGVDELDAEWTPDCSGKQDYDADLVSLSTRYWPRGGGFLMFSGGEFQGNESRPEIKPSAKSSILVMGKEWVSADFEGETESEVKAQVEAWAAAQWDRIRAALAGSATAGGWVAVDERKPDRAGPWLVYAAGDTQPSLTTQHPSWWNHKDDRGREYDGDRVHFWQYAPAVEVSAPPAEGVANG